MASVPRPSPPPAASTLDSEWPLSAGGIPGPIAFGWVIDKACLLWQDLCGQNGFCLVYQNAAMSRYLLSAGLVYKVSWGGVGAGLSSPRWGPAASARGPRPGASLPQRFAERCPCMFAAVVGTVVTR